MPYLVGFGLAVVVACFARFVGLDRGRAFYSTLVIIVATYYGLFAIMGGSGAALAQEMVGIGGFVVLGVLSLRRSLWFAAAGLFAHGVFDYFHGHLITNPGLPEWWPAFCMTYDVVAAVVLAWLLRSGRLKDEEA